MDPMKTFEKFKHNDMGIIAVLKKLQILTDNINKSAKNKSTPNLRVRNAMHQ